MSGWWGLAVITNQSKQVSATDRRRSAREGLRLGAQQAGRGRAEGAGCCLGPHTQLTILGTLFLFEIGFVFLKLIKGQPTSVIFPSFYQNWTNRH